MWIFSSCYEGVDDDDLRVLGLDVAAHESGEVSITSSLKLRARPIKDSRRPVRTKSRPTLVP